MIRTIPASNALANVQTHIGHFGELFYDPANASLRVSDAVTPGGLSVSGDVKTISANLTASQIANASVTPVMIIPAPGAGLINLVVSAVYVYYFGTVGFGSGSGTLCYNGNLASNADDSDEGVFQNTHSVFYSGGQNWTTIALSDAENAAITYATNSNSYIGGGDGRGVIHVAYWTIGV
jgi:hypothetical protein